MNTPRTNAEVWIHDYMGKKFSVVDADFARQLETEVQELRAALDELLGWSESIKGCAVTPSVVDNGEIFKEARAALAKVPK